jgi:hypothetical protein
MRVSALYVILRTCSSMRYIRFIELRYYNKKLHTIKEHKIATAPYPELVQSSSASLAGKHVLQMKGIRYISKELVQE